MMSKKIICIGIVSMFLLTSLSMSAMGKNITKIDACEKPTLLIQNIKKLEIRVRCANEIMLFGIVDPYDIDTTLTITNIATDESIVLTTEDMEYPEYFEGNQVYIVELEDGNYNIVCSIELPSPWKSTEKEKECNTSVPSFIWFDFDSKIKIRSRSRALNIQSLFIGQFSLLQHFLQRLPAFQ